MVPLITQLQAYREPLIYSSHHRKSVSSVLNFPDSALAITPEVSNPERNDDLSFNQHFHRLRHFLPASISISRNMSIFFTFLSGVYPLKNCNTMINMATYYWA